MAAMRRPIEIPCDIDFQVKHRLRDLVNRNGIDVPRRATTKEIARIAGYFGVTFGVEFSGELAAWIGMSLGPILLDRPIMGFGPSSESVHPNFDSTMASYPAWRELRWCPVAIDGCGNYYVVSAEGGRVRTIRPVFFVDTAKDWSTPAYAVASHLFYFLIFLLDYEFVADDEYLVENELAAAAWPFNKEYVLERDPNLELVEDYPLPWELDE